MTFLPRDTMLLRYAVIVCPSVRFVCPSQVKALTRPAKPRIVQSTPGILLFDAKDLCKIPTGSAPTGAPNRGGVRPISRYISEMVQDRT